MSQRIFGIHAVKAALEAGSGSMLVVRGGRLSRRQLEVIELAESLDVTVVRKDIATGTVDQGIMLETLPVRFRSEGKLLELLDQLDGNGYFLVLDGVTDTRNFGACLRNAASFGLHGVIVPKDHSAPLSPAAIKVASGAASITPVFQVTNLARCIDGLKKAGLWIIGTSLSDATRSFADVDLSGPVALVMGAEGKGIRPKTARCCDYLVEIPMPFPDLSLNVAVATGICLYEVYRQRSAS